MGYLRIVHRREDGEEIYLPVYFAFLIGPLVNAHKHRKLTPLYIWVTSPTPQPLFRKIYFILHRRVSYPSSKKENLWEEGANWLIRRERRETSRDSENANKIYV